MNADAELNSVLGRKARIALDHAVLHLDRAAHGVDHAAELDKAAVSSALDHATVMQGDGRIDQITSQRSESRQGAILVRSREPAIADNVRDQDRCNFPGLAHGAPSGTMRHSTKTGRSRWLYAEGERA